ncbi:MAG: glycoside hydrolase family 3 N-terminal domain-containing protein [Leifsonia sp.]
MTTGVPSPDLSLEEMTTLLSGADFASTKALPDHDIRTVVMTDGPHGVAMNLPDWSGKVAATCFPTATNLASTWNPELIEKVGRAIGAEARAAGAHVLLGPGMNIKRSPLGGRNFEYYSEDPLVTGASASAFVRGVQSAGVGACIKHFAVNNQETDRMRVSAEVSDRALKEIYLAGFEQVVRDAKPWMVMASYNRINGVYAAENPWLLTQTLRGDWDFDGVVVSDWGAVDDRVKSLAAGLDLEMPSTSGASDRQVAEAVRHGDVSEDAVRASADRLVTLARRAHAAAAGGEADPLQHDALALEAARESIVLLSNDDGALPVAPGASMAVLGELAERPRIQGGGSSSVNARPTGSLLDALRVGGGPVRYARAYDLDTEAADDALVAEAVEVAREADTTIVVLGLPADAESEGYDRAGIELPSAQIALLRAVSEVASTLVVVLNSGGVVSTEWSGLANAILTIGLPGQAGPQALSDVIHGRVNPSGRLAETIPVSLASHPSAVSFPGEGGKSYYGEGVFVGYRYFDTVGGSVGFAFGHGLGYTTFSIGDAGIRREGEDLTLAAVVSNGGEVTGAEVVQVYLRPPSSPVRRPAQTLAGYAKVHLQPGESSTVEISIPRRAFARYDEATADWAVDAGAWTVAVGSSSRDIRCTVEVDIASSAPEPPLGLDSTLGEWMAHPDAGPDLTRRLLDAEPEGQTVGLLTNPMALTMIGGMPIHRLSVDEGNALTLDILQAVLDDLPIDPRSSTGRAGREE